ncbi:MAG: PIN domain-containing protein [Nitrososphaerota archaeon]|nr:PIN domain-containing protein [Nitrososphaerota archaeon]
MSGRGSAPRALLVDTDLFFYYLRGGALERQAEDVVKDAEAGTLSLRTSSEVYDDAILALRSDEFPLEGIREFLSDMMSIPHVSVPMSAQAAAEAVALYMEFGGRGRLSYFDSFHVATAKSLDLVLLTSDGYIVKNASRLGVRASDLAKWRRGRAGDGARGVSERSGEADPGRA